MQVRGSVIEKKKVAVGSLSESRGRSRDECYHSAVNKSMILSRLKTDF